MYTKKQKCLRLKPFEGSQKRRVQLVIKTYFGLSAAKRHIT